MGIFFVHMYLFIFRIKHDVFIMRLYVMFFKAARMYPLYITLHLLCIICISQEFSKFGSL